MCVRTCVTCACTHVCIRMPDHRARACAHMPVSTHSLTCAHVCVCVRTHACFSLPPRQPRPSSAITWIPLGKAYEHPRSAACLKPLPLLPPRARPGSREGGGSETRGRRRRPRPPGFSWGRPPGTVGPPAPPPGPARPGASPAAARSSHRSSVASLFSKRRRRPPPGAAAARQRPGAGAR